MRKLTIWGMVAAFAAVFAVLIVAALKVEVTEVKPQQEMVRRSQDLAEDVSLTQHGLYGVTLVSIGKAHIRKLRKGPFTIGAINELVLENVSLTLPEKENEASQQTDDGKRDGGHDPKEILNRLGLDASKLKMGSKMPRFSALKINGIMVSRLSGTNSLPWFAAQRAEASRAGLELSYGWSMENGIKTQWERGMLLVSPKLKLITPPTTAK